MSTAPAPAPAEIAAGEVPDCTAALDAWRHAFNSSYADDDLFLLALIYLRGHFSALLAQAPTGGRPLTFGELARMPEPTQGFYSDLICAAESLADLIAFGSSMQARHGPLALIGDALGAFRDTPSVRMVTGCGCAYCREALSERAVSAFVAYVTRS